MEETEIPLLKVIEEQEDFSFNGRINILDKENSQLLGFLLLKTGKVFYSTFKGKLGVNALLSAVLETHRNHSYIIEPEIVDKESSNIFISHETLIDECKKAFYSYNQYKNLKPPLDLKFKINNEQLLEQEKLEDKEFDILKIIVESNDVDTIYKKSFYPEYETTKILVLLRKHSILQTYSHKK